MVIIDGHSHAYPPEDLPKLAGRLAFLDGSLPAESPHRWKLQLKGDLASLIAAEAAAGVDRFVLLPVATRPERVSELNHWVALAAGRTEAIIPFAGLHPFSANPAADLAEALVLGLKGVKLHSLLQRFQLLCPESLSLAAAVEAAGLPLLLDTLHGPGLIKAKPHLAAFEGEFGPFATTPAQIAELARRRPGLSIIAAHMGCLYGWDQVDPLLELDNVYFDLAYVDQLLEPAQALELIERRGIERVIWGTDSPWRDIPHALAWLDRLGLGAEDKSLVAGGNLARLLDL